MPHRREKKAVREPPISAKTKGRRVALSDLSRSRHDYTGLHGDYTGLHRSRPLADQREAALAYLTYDLRVRLWRQPSTPATGGKAGHPAGVCKPGGAFFLSRLTGGVSVVLPRWGHVGNVPLTLDQEVEGSSPSSPANLPKMCVFFM